MVTDCRYDYVADFGMQGMAYIVGRLWYSGMTTWLDARGATVGVKTDSIVPLSVMAVVSTAVGLLASILVRKVFKGAVLVRKRAPREATPVPLANEESGLDTSVPSLNGNTKIMV